MRDNRTIRGRTDEIPKGRQVGTWIEHACMTGFSDNRYGRPTLKYGVSFLFLLHGIGGGHNYANKGLIRQAFFYWERGRLARFYAQAFNLFRPSNLR